MSQVKMLIGVVLLVITSMKWLLKNLMTALEKAFTWILRTKKMFFYHLLGDLKAVRCFLASYMTVVGKKVIKILSYDEKIHANNIALQQSVCNWSLLCCNFPYQVIFNQ